MGTHALPDASIAGCSGLRMVLAVPEGQPAVEVDVLMGKPVIAAPVALLTRAMTLPLLLVNQISRLLSKAAWVIKAPGGKDAAILPVVPGVTTPAVSSSLSVWSLS